MTMAWRVRRRWRRIDAENADHCLCGRPTYVMLRYGPAEFPRCEEHQGVPLTAMWASQADGTFLPGEPIEPLP